MGEREESGGGLALIGMNGDSGGTNKLEAAAVGGGKALRERSVPVLVLVAEVGLAIAVVLLASLGDQVGQRGVRGIQQAS